MPLKSALCTTRQSYVDNNNVASLNTSNLTYISHGPIMETIQSNQFQILLPSFVYTSVLMALGFPGNLIVICVYLRKMKRTTSRHFIISLAVCDFINCAFGMPVELALIAKFYEFDFPILCKVSRFSTFFMNNTSSTVLIGIAVDRFRRVCLPLKPNMTVNHSKIICILLSIISMFTALPALFIYGTKTSCLSGPENNTRIVLKTCFVDDSVGVTFPLVFNLYMTSMIVIMFLSLTVMYALVGRVIYSGKTFSDKRVRRTVLRSPGSSYSNRSSKIWQSFHNRSLMSHTESQLPVSEEPLRASVRAHSDTSVRRHGGTKVRPGRTTLILFIVTLMFVLSFVPYLAIVTIRYIQPSLIYTTSALYHFALRSYLLNSAVNPIIYCFLNLQFREEVKLFFLSFCGCVFTK